jgi:hypothetical protein
MRLFGTLAVVMVFTGMAMADIPLPPKPSDSKTVSGSCFVSVGPKVQGWVFVTSQAGFIPGRKGPPPVLFESVELGEKKIVDLAGKTLYAIPAEVAKAYPKDADLTDAVRKGKLEGVQKHHFSTPTIEVRKGEKIEPPNSVSVVTSIDEKGIHLSEATPKPQEKKKPLALAEPGYLIGGIALAVSVTLGGLWLMRRKKADR